MLVSGSTKHYDVNRLQTCSRVRKKHVVPYLLDVDLSQNPNTSLDVCCILESLLGLIKAVAAATNPKCDRSAPDQNSTGLWYATIAANLRQNSNLSHPKNTVFESKGHFINILG